MSDDVDPDDDGDDHDEHDEHDEVDVEDREGQVGRQPINYRPAEGEVGQLVRFVIMIRPSNDQTKLWSDLAMIRPNYDQT